MGNIILRRNLGALAATLMLMTLGAVAHAADSYNTSTHELTIPTIQVGQTIYTDVIVYIALSQVISIGGGTPASNADTYVNGILRIPAVNVNGNVYTNVAANVSLSDVLYIGGHTLANLSSAPGETALVGFLQTSHQYSLIADDRGNSFTIHLSSSPNSGTTTFGGQAPAYGTVDSIAFYENGTLVANSVTTNYYLLNPYVPLGNISSTGSPYALVTSSTPFPATLTVGSSGPEYALTYYHNSNKTILDAYEVGSYVVSANNSVSLNLCLNSVISNTTAQGTSDGLGNGTESDCYTVDASGNAALTSITLVVDGVTLNFK